MNGYRLGLFKFVLEAARVATLTVTLLESIAQTGSLTILFGTTGACGATLTLSTATGILLHLATVLAPGRLVLELLLCVELLLTNSEGELTVALLCMTHG
jgi:hypothetical protein